VSVDRNGFVIEIRRGEGQPHHLALSPGTTVNPMSIGLMGDWRVEAQGILDVHAFVYFDGSALFVQSVDGHNVVRVNGKPVGQDWTEISPPCTLALGDARLVYCPASQASAVSAPPSARPAAGRGAFDDAAPTMADVRPGDYDDAVSTQRTPAPDDEATGSIPLPGGGFVAPTPPPDDDNETTRALPLPAIAMGGAPHFAVPAPPTPIAQPAPQPIAAPPPAPPTVEKPKPLDQLKAQWKQASLPKKAIAILLPLAFVMVIFGLDDDPPPRAATKPAPSASASAKTAKSAKPEKSAEPEDLEPEKPTPAPIATAAKPAPSPANTKTAPAAVSSQKTAERAAVDAVAAGAWEPAAKMYDELAKQHPENPAYKEAARILRAKAKK